MEARTAPRRQATETDQDGFAAPQPAGPPRVVVVGAGFGGLWAAKALRKVQAKVTVIDRRNHHLFQPLLYQVATAGLSPADIATPIRAIMRDQPNAEVLMARVVGVDRQSKELLIADSHRRISYDYLVIATGARHAYFGHDDWEGWAPGLKKIDDATAIRHRILIAFEKAETETDPEERQRLLTFVVIGGGPTGVEMAGTIAELSRKTLVEDFRTINPASARVVLIEGGPRVLSAFPPELSAKAEKSLAKLGVEVVVDRPVEQCDEDGVLCGGRRIAARTLIWGAGVQASSAGRWLHAEMDCAGRVKVGPDLSIPGDPNIFVIGDTATVPWRGEQPVPGIAPAAKLMGAYVGKLIANRIEGGPAPAPFRYRHLGNFATIGRHAAVADFGWLKISGYPAWLLWGAAHIFFLIGFRNRIVVMLDWMWAYIAFHRGARLITGSGDSR